MKRGFTLVELLAIIIIAGTISVVSFTAITNTIKKNQIRETEVFENNILNASKLYVSANLDKFEALETTGAIVELTSQELIDNGYLKSTITNPTNINLNNYYVIIIKNPNGYLDYILANTNEEPTLPSYKYIEPMLNGADPVLESGMIPIYFEGNVAKVASLTNEWYNYENKKWANVILVNNDRRGYYQNADKGTVVQESDVIGYYVWIPRYKFKIFTYSHSSDLATIDIKFQSKTEKDNNNTVGQYKTHPAFTLGGIEMAGLWFGKFDTTGTLNNITVKPNESIINGIEIGVAHQKLNEVSNITTGIKQKLRISKLSEWSAAAYLSSTNYGINIKIRPNNNLSINLIKSGCGSNEADVSSTASCVNEYGSYSSYPQSSTGNITGVFDMSAGAWENVMSFLGNEQNEPIIGNNASQTSGFKGNLIDGNTITEGVALPESKYYEILPNKPLSTVCAERNHIGYLMCGTSNWYGELFDYKKDGPILQVGGGQNFIEHASQFTYYSYYGAANNGDGFRIVISME